MIGKDSEPRGGDIDYKVVQTVAVDPYLVDVAKKAAADVWQRHVGEPTTMTLRFVPSLAYQGTFRRHNPAGSYHWDSDTISFAVGKINAPDQNLSDAHKTAIIAGHEARHRVQVHRGETVKPSSEMTREEYDSNPHEREAREEGDRVFRELYPDAYKWVAYGYAGPVRDRMPVDPVPERKVIDIYTRPEKVIIDLAPQLILPDSKSIIIPPQSRIQKFIK